MNVYTIREATPADAPGIRRLFERVFGVGMSQEEWEWKYERDPDGWLGVVAVVAGEIAGNYAGWAMRFRLDGEERILYSVGDVATDPAVRHLGGRRGIYRSMAEAFYERVRARGVPFCFGFPNARALAISHRIVGSRTLFPIREVLVPCDAFPPEPRGAASEDFVRESFDELWTRASLSLPLAAVRDRLRANWRFHARPTRYYRMVSRESGGRLQGWAVLSVIGEKAILADFLCVPSEEKELNALFSIAASEARRMGASHIVLWETPGGPAASAIGQLPGERREAGFPLIVRSFDDTVANQFAREVHLVPALYDVI